MTLDFLSIASGDSLAIARSPMERQARAAGARFEIRNGWNLAVEYDNASRHTTGWTDVSHLRKLELQGREEDLPALTPGTALRADGAWWCPITQTRALVIGEAPSVEESAVSVLDVTTVFAAMTLVGPLAREIFARFCAIDLRPESTPLHAVRPGSIARQPGLVLREDDDRFLFLFGWAVAQYMWTVVEDAGRHLGAAPIGIDSLEPVRHPIAHTNA